MRSVWSRVGPGTLIVVVPSAARAASVRQPRTWALATGTSWSTAIERPVAVDAHRSVAGGRLDPGAGLAEGRGDPFHGPRRQRGVADEVGPPRSARERTGQEAHRRAGVAAVERLLSGAGESGGLRRAPAADEDTAWLPDLGRRAPPRRRGSAGHLPSTGRPRQVGPGSPWRARRPWPCRAAPGGPPTCQRARAAFPRARAAAETMPEPARPTHRAPPGSRVAGRSWRPTAAASSVEPCRGRSGRRAAPLRRARDPQDGSEDHLALLGREDATLGCGRRAR